MPWTKHGHWYGLGAPEPPQPRLVTRCGGPHLCTECALEAQRGDADDRPRREPDMAGPSVTIGISPQPERLIAMLRIIASHAKACRAELAAVPVEETIAALAIIARHADGCADDLEAAQQDDAQRRADDDGRPPTY